MTEQEEADAEDWRAIMEGTYDKKTISRQIYDIANGQSRPKDQEEQDKQKAQIDDFLVRRGLKAFTQEDLDKMAREDEERSRKQAKTAAFGQPPIIGVYVKP